MGRYKEVTPSGQYNFFVNNEKVTFSEDGMLPSIGYFVTKLHKFLREKKDIYPFLFLSHKIGICASEKVQF